MLKVLHIPSRVHNRRSEESIQCLVLHVEYYACGRSCAWNDNYLTTISKRTVVLPYRHSKHMTFCRHILRAILAIGYSLHFIYYILFDSIYLHTHFLIRLDLAILWRMDHAIKHYFRDENPLSLSEIESTWHMAHGSDSPSFH